MKATFILVGILGALAVPVMASAQGVVGGAPQGASQGAREGSVKGALGVSDKPKRKPKKQTNNWDWSPIADIAHCTAYVRFRG